MKTINQKYGHLLGAKVFPIVKRSQYGAMNHDTAGLLPYKQGTERQLYAKYVVDEATKEQRKINKEQDWEVWAIYADGSFCLISDYGYEQDHVLRNDFRLIK